MNILNGGKDLKFWHTEPQGSFGVWGSKHYFCTWGTLGLTRKRSISTAGSWHDPLWAGVVYTAVIPAPDGGRDWRMERGQPRLHDKALYLKTNQHVGNTTAWDLLESQAALVLKPVPVTWPTSRLLRDYSSEPLFSSRVEVRNSAKQLASTLGM